MKELTVSLLFYVFLGVIALVRIYTYSFAHSSSIVTAPSEIEGMLYEYPYNKNGVQVMKINDYVIKAAVLPSYKVGQYLMIKQRNKRQSKYQNDVYYYPKIRVVSNKTNELLLFLSSVRTKIIYRIQKNMPEPDASLILGMLIGYKGEFSERLGLAFKKSGTIHVIVVSGYNVSLVISMVSGLFARLGRFLYITGVILFVILFVLLAGLAPPVIRASLMGVIGGFAMFNGEYKSSAITLVFVCLLMLIIHPQYLFDIGFQMSFMATLGVIVSTGISKKNNFLISEFITVLIVNLFLFPIVSYYFNVINPGALIANPLILWVIPYITIIGMILIFIPIMPVKIFVGGLISFFIFIVNFVASFNFSQFEFRVNVVFVVFYYLLLTVLWKWRYLVRHFVRL